MLLILLILTWPGLVAIAIAWYSLVSREDAVEKRDSGRAARTPTGRAGSHREASSR